MALEWPSLLRTADEWIITYALPYELFHVQLFAIGHAVELYLKVANAKITGDMDRAVKFGHSIPRLLSDCKNHDSSFMIGYELRDSVLAVDMMNQNTWSKLSREDYLHLGNHQELYFVAQYLPDLKYLGGPLKNRKNNGPSAFAYLIPNDYWISFFKDLRKFLDYPAKNGAGAIAHCLRRRELPASAVEFLSRLG